LGPTRRPCEEPGKGGRGSGRREDEDTPFIVLTETKFSFRCIPVWDHMGWKIKLIIFVEGTCGSVHTQTFNNNLKELGVVESKRNIIRKGLVHELLNAQDTVLCSCFAQRSGERDASRSETGMWKKLFKGWTVSFEVWSEEVDRGKEDCKQAAQANRLTFVLGQKGGSRVWQP
jgi:hypothetical protein